MDDRLTVRSEPEADPGELAMLADGIDRRNVELTGVRDYRRIVQALRDEAGVLAGGLAGHVWGGWLYVDHLFIAEAHRRRGWGSRLLAAAEAEAIEAGAHHAYLHTFSFQAAPFYERHGYRVAGELADFPMGESMYLMHKALGDG